MHGSIILVDPRTGWCLIRANESADLYPGQINFAVSKSLCIQPNLRFIAEGLPAEDLLRSSSDWTEMASNLDTEISSAPYDTPVIFDPVSSIFVLSNGVDCLIGAKLTASDAVHIPAHYHLPSSCTLAFLFQEVAPNVFVFGESNASKKQVHRILVFLGAAVVILSGLATF